MKQRLALVVGQRVRAHVNLHRSTAEGRMYSVLDARTGRVLGHTSSLSLVAVTFVVRPAGRARAVREGRRNVHAFVIGEVSARAPDVARWCRVTYNPWRAPTFVVASTQRPVTRAWRVELRADGTYAARPT